jgi:hypothetical protein
VHVKVYGAESRAAIRAGMPTGGQNQVGNRNTHPNPTTAQENESAPRLRLESRDGLAKVIGIALCTFVYANGRTDPNEC